MTRSRRRVRFPIFSWEVGEERETEESRAVVQDLERVLRCGIYDLRADRLLLLPFLKGMGSDGTTAITSRRLRERLLELLDAIGPGTAQNLALALFGATPDTRSKVLEGRREIAGHVARPEKPLSSDAIRRRPSGREAKLLLYLADEILSLEDSATPADREASGRRLLGLEGAEKIRAFWNLRRRSSVDIVCSEIPADELPYFADPADRNYLRYAKFADLDSLIYVRTRLAQLFPSVTLRDFAPSEHYDTNGDALLVVGGPAWNATFREFQERLPFHFEEHPIGDDDPLVLDADGERRLGPSWGPGSTVRADVSIVVRLTLDDGHLVYLLGGCLTYGVLGAAKLLLDERTAPANIDFIERYAQGADFIVACRSHRLGTFLEAPYLQANAPLAVLVRSAASSDFRPVFLDRTM